MRDDFVTFILSYDRPGRVPTLKALEDFGYSGDWYIIIDHEDDIGPYKSEYGEDKVIYFDKEEMIGKFDRADNFDRRDCNVYARNKVFEIADELGYDYFFMLDDDYNEFRWRFNENFNYDVKDMDGDDLDQYIDSAIEYIEKADINALCMAQGGDYIGGSKGSMAQNVKTKRKAMNTFILRTDSPVHFRGTINEDVTAYVRGGQLGKLFLTINFANVEQERTQQYEGGLTDIYKDQGTYVKSFYTILHSPSSVKLGKLRGPSYERIHHRVNWNQSVPKIVPESTKN